MVSAGKKAVASRLTSKWKNNDTIAPIFESNRRKGKKKSKREKGRISTEN